MLLMYERGEPLPDFFRNLSFAASSHVVTVGRGSSGPGGRRWRRGEDEAATEDDVEDEGVDVEIGSDGPS